MHEYRDIHLNILYYCIIIVCSNPSMHLSYISSHTHNHSHTHTHAVFIFTEHCRIAILSNLVLIMLSVKILVKVIVCNFSGLWDLGPLTPSLVRMCSCKRLLEGFTTGMKSDATDYYNNKNLILMKTKRNKMHCRFKLGNVSR